MKLELQAGEKILARHRARMYKRGRWSGWRGRLILTDRRIWFEANVLNLFGTQKEIPFTEITGARLKNTLGFIPNCLEISTRNGEIFDFITLGRRRILEIINAHAGREIH